MLGNLAIANSHNIDGFKLNRSTGRSHTEELSLMGSVIRFVGCHEFSFGCLPMDLCVEVRECGAKCAIESTHAVFIRDHVWLRCVVHEVVGEEFIEDFEVPLALYLFSISTDESFGGIG